MTKINDQYSQGTIGKGFIYSLLFHAVIIALAIVGLPHMKTREFEAPQPISIEFVTIDEIVKTTKPPKEPEKPIETKPKEDKPKPPPTVNSEVIPTNIKKEEVTLPPEESPAPEETLKPVLSEEIVSEKPAIKKPKPKPEKPKIKPKPKKKEQKKDEEKTSDAFASLLKNISPEESKPQTDSSQQGQLSKTITADELAAVRQQLSHCWNLLPGARDADKLVVELRIKVFPDRTVQRVDITDTYRYKTDPFFRAAADNAVRAINNPACSPLNLPPDKYTLWKDIIFNFDPRGMF